MFCPSCQTRNQFFNNYCYYCGYKLKETDNPSQNIQESQDEKHSLDTNTFDIARENQTTKARDEKDQDAMIGNENSSFDENKIGRVTAIDKEERSFTEDESQDNATIDDEPEKQPIDGDHFSNTYEYLFENDGILDDNNLFGDSNSPEFDLSTQIPLRRYQKDKPPYRSKGIFKVILSIFTLALAGFAIFLWASKIGQRAPRQVNLSQSIAVSSSIEEITEDGKKAYRIVFNTVNGKEVSFLGEVVEMENGRAEFVIEEALLYTYHPQLSEDGSYEVNVDAIITAPNLPESIERISITLSQPSYAPFDLLQPSSSETEFQGDSSKVAFKIQPGSKVIINEQDFTDLVSEDGRFEKEFSLSSPQQDELVLDIRVSTPGFLDNIQKIILRKTAMDVPLTINETSPIFSNEQWIKVSGTTHPEAILDADLEIFEEPEINRETGDFTAYFKAERSGYTPCILTAKLGDQKSSIEIILDRKSNVDTYTSTAWKPDYDELQQDDQHSNGRHFAIIGNIKDIIETGEKNVFTVSPSEESESEQLFYIEYWGSFDYNTGDRVRVFGNRWGNKDNIPRFLAKYIYD